MLLVAYFTSKVWFPTLKSTFCLNWVTPYTFTLTSLTPEAFQDFDISVLVKGYVSLKIVSSPTSITTVAFYTSGVTGVWTVFPFSSTVFLTDGDGSV